MPGEEWSLPPRNVKSERLRLWIQHNPSGVQPSESHLRRNRFTCWIIMQVWRKVTRRGYGDEWVSLVVKTKRLMHLTRVRWRTRNTNGEQIIKRGIKPVIYHVFIFLIIILQLSNSIYKSQIFRDCQKFVLKCVCSRISSGWDKTNSFLHKTDKCLNRPLQ